MKTTLKFVAVTAAAVLLTAASASAQVVKMRAVLSPGEETPALLSGAVGTAEVGSGPGVPENCRSSCA